LEDSITLLNNEPSTFNIFIFLCCPFVPLKAGHCFLWKDTYPMQFELCRLATHGRLFLQERVFLGEKIMIHSFLQMRLLIR